MSKRQWEGRLWDVNPKQSERERESQAQSRYVRLRGVLSGAERRAFGVVVCDVTSSTLWADDADDDADDG